MSEPGSRIDLTSASGGREAAPEPSPGRFLGVTFDCCGVYSRIYPNRAGDAYEGRCPKCLGQLRIGIGPGGSSHRFFTAS